MRLALVVIVTLLSLGCSSAPRAASATPAPTALPTPRSATATPPPDYRGMALRLATPLSALIVAVRAGNPNQTAAGHLANFNAEADRILPAIEGDTSKPANMLHSAIVNVRAHPGDLTELEQIRRSLVTDF